MSYGGQEPDSGVRCFPSLQRKKNGLCPESVPALDAEIWVLLSLH